MKHLFNALFLIAAILYTLPSTAQDFRKVSWGMSKSEVKQAEELELFDERDDGLLYETTIANEDVYLVYFFFKGKLTRAKYLLSAEYLNDNQHYEDYIALNELLEKKYGEPIDIQVNWIDEVHEEPESAHWGTAVGYGHLSLSRTYSTETTEITSSLYADDTEVVNEILYHTKDEELLKLEQEVILEDF